MLPLEQSERLVDEGQNVNSHGLALLLHLHGLIELLNGLGEILLVKEKFTIVVVDIRHILEVLHGSSESGHGGCDRSHLVLCYTQLDVRVDEGTVKVDGLLVVLSGFGKFAEDEVKLGAVVVDISVVLVVGDSEFKVVRSGILVSYSLSVRSDTTTNGAAGFRGVYQVQGAD